MMARLLPVLHMLYPSESLTPVASQTQEPGVWFVVMVCLLQVSRHQPAGFIIGAVAYAGLTPAYVLRAASRRAFHSAGPPFLRTRLATASRAAAVASRTPMPRDDTGTPL